MTFIKYEPLNRLKAEIRVITILPQYSTASIAPIVNTNGYVQLDVVSCHIKHVSLKNPKAISVLSQRNWTNDGGMSTTLSPPQWRYEWGDYVALSYTWGSPDYTRTIIVNDQEITVRSNLEAALRVLRDKEPIRVGFAIWIDALCINQGDVPERNEEVKRMRTIYKQARDVVVWLGEEADDSAQAIGLLKVLAGSVKDGTDKTLGQSLRKTPDVLGYGSWKALCQLMERPYWDRLWIMQEISMGGSNTLILCGKDVVSWAELYYGIYTFGTHNTDLVFTLIGQECHDAGMSTSSGLHRNKIIHLWEEQKVQAGFRPSQSMCMLDLGRKALVSDPRDKVFGVLGMMPAVVAEQIRPDYNMSLAEVYTSFAEILITKSQSLEILEQCTWQSSSMPSWVPDWNNQNHYRLFSGRSTYHATLGQNENFHIDIEGGKLSCRATVIGDIDGLGASYYYSHPSSDPEEALLQPKNSNNPYGSKADLSDALWRALTGDRTPPGKAAPDSYRSLLKCPLPAAAPETGNSHVVIGRGRAALNLLLLQNSEFRIAGRQFASFFPPSGDADPEDARDALERLFRFIRSRRLMTTSIGHIGLVPHAARRGDFVAVLLGCNVPMVLRPAEQHQHYRVVGGCYLHGFMEGEAIIGQGEGRLRLETVVLC